MSATRGGRRPPVDWAAVRGRLAAATAGAELTEEQARAVLSERARRLAVPPRPPEAPSATFDVVTFSLGSEAFALEARLVREVVRLVSVTPLPGAPGHVPGVVNLRGEVLMVVDLRRLLGIERPGVTDLSRVLVVGEERPELGILADSARELRRLRRPELLDPPVARERLDRRLLLGVTREALVVLDGRALLQDPRLVVGAGDGTNPNAGVAT